MTDDHFLDEQAAPAVSHSPAEMDLEDFADVPWVRWPDEDSAFQLGLRPLPTTTGSALLPFERKRLIEAVRREDSKAQLEIALLFAQNAAHETDKTRADHLNHRANEWLEKAAAGGSAEALYQLGKRHQSGFGTGVDLATAASFFERSVALGHTEANYELGRAYLCGGGVPQDLERGAALLRQAADSYHVQAGYVLGYCYFNGEGVPVDKGKAQTLLDWAASRGHLLALENQETAERMGDRSRPASWWAYDKREYASAVVASPGTALASGSSEPLGEAQGANVSLLNDVVSEGRSILDDGINWCVFHAYNVGMAYGLSWILWMFVTGWLSTTDLLWGADHAGSHPNATPGVGIFRLAVFENTGFEEPFFCCFLVGVAITFVIGTMCLPFGLFDAITEGHTETARGMVGGTKVLQSATHVAGFGLSVAIGAIEQAFGAERVGESAIMGALAGWGYLRPMVTIYETPVRYTLNLVYGGAIFAFLFPIASHAVVGSYQNITAHEWGWLVWTLLLGYVILIPVGLYLQAAWYQGYGLGLWLGSWVPPRGWKLRRIYRLPASECFHNLGSSL